MKPRLSCLLVCASVVLLLQDAAFAVSITTVAIGDPGNPPDTDGNGAVAYHYRMGTTEVTNAQYVEFLNAVAASDPLELFDERMGTSTIGGIVRSGGPGTFAYDVKDPALGEGPNGTDYTYENKPVVFASWYDAVRFANWLHNGQGSGDTETGSYTLVGGGPTPTNGPDVVRNPGGTWLVPTLDEWYKAAYYDPGAGIYFDYPTGTDAEPDGNLPFADSGNSVNGGRGSTNPFPLTDVGAYTLSPSPYGTFDQGGNVWEWTELLSHSLNRALRGGAWSTSPPFSSSIGGSALAPASSSPFTGFRVVNIPEPATGLLASLAFVVFLMRPRGGVRPPR